MAKSAPHSPPTKARRSRPPTQTDQSMATREEMRTLLATVKAMRKGDFSMRMPALKEGLISEVGEVLNDIIEMNETMANEFVRVRNMVGQEGKMTERVSLGHAKGAWATSVDSINLLIGDLVQPTTEVARVITSVAMGDLSQKMSLEIDGRSVKGEFRRIGTTVNAMVDQLNSFASEVTRVAKEVGTEGKLGGQAHVKGVSGTWKDLTDNVNGLAGNLTAQVRNIAKVTTAVAKGDLSQKITVDAKGEIFELKNHHQHHGRSVVVVRGRGDPRGQGGGHRGAPRRAGQREGRIRHVERFDRQREWSRRQPDRAGA